MSSLTINKTINKEKKTTPNLERTQLSLPVEGSDTPSCSLVTQKSSHVELENRCHPDTPSLSSRAPLLREPSSALPSLHVGLMQDAQAKQSATFLQND